MAKNLPKRFVTEKAVKKALKIDSFRKLSKEKMMQFVSMIPYIDKEVAIAIINQFPKYVDFGKIAISYYTQLNNNILEQSKEKQADTVKGYQTILDALSKRMSMENITENERKAITEDMIAVADKIAETNLQYQKFLDRMGNRVLVVFLGVTALIGAGIGISSKFSGGEIPQLADDEDDENEV